ncbi:Adenine phosphoribosyltransferase [Blattella germanica]|nr:Adenine phosphoribosyltransferase [Blattella germanica]
MADLKQKLDFVKENIKSYPDFPKPGIIFRDIFSVLRNPPAFQALQDILIDYVANLSPKPDVIVALESRGFLIGPLLSLHFKIPFVPVRKRGKLPGNVKQQEYALEYGTDVFEIQTESIHPGQNVLIVDDLLATGGSMKAACLLLDQLKAKVVQCLVIMELKALNGRKDLHVPIHSFVQY